MIFRAPRLTREDDDVLGAIHALRRELADVLRTPRRWQGGLRRTMLARAIRGSNSIEGYEVDIDDAAAALEGEEPLTADERTFAEVRGYRDALGYVLQMATDPHFKIDLTAVRGMHYMMLAHDLSKSPGQYRPGSIQVHDDREERVVYEGLDAALVPGLMNEFIDSLHSGNDPIVNAAMAHLNLVMIHPFRDGNGRMARALQTLVLAREAIVEPQFSSIEEWLGHNTEDYYRVLAITGQGSWRPESDTTLWVRFNLRAHHMQAQTVRHRFEEASAIWTMLDEVVAEHGLPARVADLLYEAVLGYRVRRSVYVRAADLEVRTASRDLKLLVEANILSPQGQTKGRYYVAGQQLRDIRRTARARRAELEDPYPWMPLVLLEESV